jgi:poly(3-hydroxybutyrate) depolymerase
MQRRKARHLWVTAVGLLALAAQDTWAAKLTLNPNLITLDAGSDGDPKRLADEQAAAGDPRAGDRPDLTTSWTSTSGIHVNAAIVDLGATYEIDRIYLYDTNGSGGDFTVTAGSPTSGWTNTLASNPLNHYKVWKGFPNNTANDGTGFVDDPTLEYSGVTTRYLRVVNPTGFLGMPEIVVYATSVATSGDVAAGKPVIGSSVYDPALNPASAAVDGNATTLWRSSGSARPYTYLEVDLQGYYSISRFDLELGDTAGSAPPEFEIQAQNEGCWKTVPGTSVSGHPSTDTSESFTLASPVITDKVRFVCRNGGSGCRLRTLAAIGVASTASAAPPPSCGGGTQVVHRSPAYDYAEFLPAGYSNDPDQTFPLVIALHGVGGETLSADHTAIYSSPEGLAKQFLNSTFRSTFPAIAVSPHCRQIDVTTGDCLFTLARLEELWRDIMSTYRVDPDRVYITGLSGGGLASIKFALYHHQELAALLPIASNLSQITTAQKAFDSTTGDPIPDPNGLHICDMKDLPIFGVHGTLDARAETPPHHTVTFQNTMNVRCRPDHPKMVLRLIVGGKHDGTTWDETYKDQRTYDWLFAQRASDKADPATHAWPVVTTSGNKSVTMPTTSAAFTGSATDADGPIAKYSWINITDGTGTWPTVVESLTTGNATLSGPGAGTYKFRLIATDEDGFTGFKDVTLTINP